MNITPGIYKYHVIVTMVIHETRLQHKPQMTLTLLLHHKHLVAQQAQGR